MSTPLTDGINALTAYANETTGASDTTLSDAVGRLCEGYGESDTLWKTIVLEEYYDKNGLANLMILCGISEQSVLDGGIYFVECLNNSDNSNYMFKCAIIKVFEGYEGEANAIVIRRNGYTQVIFGHASNVGMSMSAGSVINIYKIK